MRKLPTSNFHGSHSLCFLGDLEKSYNVNIECDVPERIRTGICAAQAPNLIWNVLFIRSVTVALILLPIPDHLLPLAIGEGILAQVYS